MTQNSGTPLVAQPVTVTVFAFGAGAAISAPAPPLSAASAPTPAAIAIVMRMDIGFPPLCFAPVARTPLGDKQTEKAIFACGLDGAHAERAEVQDACSRAALKPCT